MPTLLIMSVESRRWPRPHVPKPFDLDALRAVFAGHVGRTGRAGHVGRTGR